MLTQKINLFKKIITAVFFICIIWTIYLHTQENKQHPLNFLFNSGYSILFVLGGLMPIYLLKKSEIKNIPQKAIMFFAFANLAYGLGLNIWTFYNFKYGAEIPYPALPDLFFFLFYPLIFVSCFYFVKMFSVTIKKRNIIEFAGFMLVFIFFIFFIIPKEEVSGEVTTIVNFLNIFYPATAATLLSISFLVLRISGGIFKKGIYPLSLGLAAHASADLLFSHRTVKETYWNGDISDVLFMVSAFLLNYALLKIISGLIPEENY